MKEHIEHQVKGKVERTVKKAVRVFFYVLAAFAFIMLFAYIFMRLWNWLMPDIFALQQLTYWQALGILIMAKLLFGGFDRGPKKPNGKHRNERKRNRWGKRCNSEYGKWEMYDRFWAEEGQKAYEAYVGRMQGPKNEEDENV